MAYAYDPNMSPEENEKKRQADESGIVADTTGPQGGVITGSASQQGPAVGSGGGSGSGFTNLQTYLAANRSQAGDMATKMADRLKGTAQETEQEIGKAKEGVFGQIESGSVRPDEQLIGRAFENPTEFVKNQGDLDQFTRQRTAQYQGPDSFEASSYYEPIRSKVAEAQGQLGQIETEQGRLDLAKGMMQQPGAGKVALNQLLLQGDPEAAQTLQGAKPAFSGLQGYLENVGTEAKAKAGQARSATEQAARTAQERLTGEQGEIPKLQTGIAQKAQEAESDRQRQNALIQAIQSKMASSQSLTPQEYIPLGMSPAQYTALENSRARIGSFYPGESTNPYSQYLIGGRLGGNAATSANVASPEDYAREAALEKLSGSPLDILQNDEAGMAGSYQPGYKMPGFDTQNAVNSYEMQLQGLDRSYMDQFQNMSAEEQAANLYRAKNASTRLREGGYDIPVPEDPAQPVPVPDEAHTVPVTDEDGNVTGWVGLQAPGTQLNRGTGGGRATASRGVA